jgi:uncharacterized protein YdcH (DUF465 family)
MSNQARFHSLVEQHKKIEGEIYNAYLSRVSDISIQRMKKKKLRLKEMIEKIKDTMLIGANDNAVNNN